MRKRLLLFIAASLSAHSAISQTSKKPLDHSVYDKWQSIGSETISDDGKWILYSVVPQEGDARLVLSARGKGSVIEVPRAGEASFMKDATHSVFLIGPPYKDVRAAKIKKKKNAEIPPDSLGILDNRTLKMQKFARVRSFRLAKQQPTLVAFLHALPDSVRKAEKKGAEEEADGEKGVKVKHGADLVLLEPGGAVVKTFKDVNDYCLSDDGKWLAFASKPSAKDSGNTAAVFLFRIQNNMLNKISAGKSYYTGLTFDESGNRLAFMAEASGKNSAGTSQLYCYTMGTDSAALIAGRHTPGLPDGWGIYTEGKLKFSKDGKRLFFATMPVTPPRDSSIVDMDVAKVDIWNYKDDYLQPMQLKNLERIRKKGYLAVADLQRSGRMIQLEDDGMTEATPGNKGNAGYALGVSNASYRIESQWEGSGKRDFYLISLSDGSRRKIAEGIKARPEMAPSGNYVVWFNRADSAWYSYSVGNNQLTALSRHLNVPFYDETNDVPDLPSSYGPVTFIEGDKGVLICDRYDIWQFALNKPEAVNLTRGYGRKNKITFRYYDLLKSRDERKEDEADVVKVGQTLYLDAFNNTTKEAGWYKTTLNTTKDPQMLTMGPVSYSRPFMAKNAPVLIYRKESYVHPPDLYISSGFAGEEKLSSINPWQKDYNWSTSELFRWTTPKGHPSEGVLYKPEDFDPSKKYPMIVYFYEKLSDNLYHYVAPAPTPSRLNISYFVSNGYLVFTPDISYEAGYPGRSAEEYINSGVEALKKFGWVDGTKIGIQGQSWGGYQVAHLITRTDMYAAAWAGAPVVNMFSAYGGIRWETGMNRQFQYEKTQSRIGATIWDRPELYVENSPLFHLRNVHTPVAIMANDADGAVPWYQGIEMFTALRRLNKPVWLLNYNDEAHNLVQRQNRKDIQRREQQFFDHFLKGAPAPVWLEKGVPASEKGRNWGFDLVTGEKGRNEK